MRRNRPIVSAAAGARHPIGVLNGVSDAVRTRNPLSAAWVAFAEAKPTLAELIVFSALNVALTVLQLVIMPVFKLMFSGTSLVDVDFQAVPVGGGFVFDYTAGALPEGGGGLAYFLAVQITLLIATVINFFLQRNVTFKSNTNVWRAAAWYTVAYVVLTFGAAALQTLYKTPIYELLMVTWGMGAAGETVADVVTMLINALISCAVFFPIFKIIFRREAEVQVVEAGPADAVPALVRERV
jgi:putative flippase GtrA